MNDKVMGDFERTFDNAAIDYDRSRIVYGKELYEDIFKYKPIHADSHVLEIGIGTGKATLPILETKCHLVAIEPGEHLASFSRKRFQAYPHFSLHNKTLQDYVCPADSFDFIYAATAFHWVPEEYGYKRVYELLKSGGAFARFAYHAGPDKQRKALTSEIQALYKQYMHSESEPREYCEEDARSLSEIAKKYGFMDTKYKLYHFTKDFTADQYMELLRTYPDHMAVQQPDREKLFDAIHHAINKNGGVITVYYTMDLQLARKP